MILVNSSTGVVISEADFRAENPLTSFPSVLQAADVEPFGVSVLVEVTQPAAMPFYTIVAGAPTQISGVWTQTWTQTPIELATAQAIQSTYLNSACASAIVSGFTSSALGTAYTYPSNITDQQNLAASVLASLLPGVGAGWTTPFWCANSSGTWAWTSHTAAQIQQVGTDGKAAVLACQSQNATLQTQVAAATNVDAVAQVAWVPTATT
jgi:hypothetical protein